MKKRWKILIGFLVLLLILFGAYQLMNARSFQLFGGLTDYVKTKEKVVALTFDDGPTKNVDDILSLLDAYDAKATFFLIGNEIEKNPLLAEEIAEKGHQLGNHTYSHERMIFKSQAFIRNEVEKTNQLIEKAGYTGEIDFRPPNGKKLVGLPYFLKQAEIDTILWNMEPDTYYQTAEDKINYVKESVKPGSIILMHPMYDKTGQERKALKGILKTLTEAGYTFVTVNELQEMADSNN
ncbi:MULTISPECIES: polysaccharide deacetylase family protein [Niallia]|jgi:peptidoglycan-N-acetylglucosamine deacetylase|nr:polysaccharide deacetylase family protein [Niallia circulans]AYV65746.1 polysaccharide deacetylase [Niallia circulans]NRG28580.1 polysaccharide deacetylase family protein [Niallia circulans]QJX61638.1 polysaccharide deacetylase family protein [Niallia circulans]UQZ73809.1 polysaccharide deacetylase [Niallia circulans]